MAFKPLNMAYHEPARGIGGLMVYVDAEDDEAAVNVANYFSDGTPGANQVRDFIRRQRDNENGTPVNNGVPMIQVLNDKLRVITYTCADDGTVAARAAAWRLTS